MEREGRLNAPWLVAAWPGMGAVGISAGYYLMAKLGMHLLEDMPAGDYFDIEQVEVKNGILSAGRLPRNRLFVWKDPAARRDLLVFLGEAQPPTRGDSFCRRLVDRARELGVDRVFTFAAMATQMRPEHQSRVFSAAIEPDTLVDFKNLGTEMLREGTITGLNGVLLGVAGERGLKGGCLLGEMPHVFPHFPYPKASLAVLKTFTQLSGCELDLAELEVHAQQVGARLAEVLDRVENTPDEQEEEGEEAPTGRDEEEGAPSANGEERVRIEALFSAAARDRSRAYELKQELDRLKLFPEYEDRFLDLFREPR